MEEEWGASQDLLIGTDYEFFFSFSTYHGRNLAYQIASVLFPGPIAPRIFIDAVWQRRTILVGDTLWDTIKEAINASVNFVPIITPSFNERAKETPMDELIHAFKQGKIIKSIWINLDPQRDFRRLNPALKAIVNHGIRYITLPEDTSRWNEEKILRYLIGSDRDVLNDRILAYQLSRPLGRYQAGPGRSAGAPVHPSNPRHIIFETQPAAHNYGNDLEAKLARYKVGYDFSLYGQSGIYRRNDDYRGVHVCVILMAQYPTAQEDGRLLQIVNYARNNNIRIMAILLGNISPDNYDPRLKGFHQLVQRRVLVESNNAWDEIVRIVAHTMAYVANHLGPLY